LSFFVLVRFKGDPKRANATLREDPDLAKNIHKGIFDYGLISTTRLIGDGEYLDIDEWKSEADRDAFVEAMRPELQRWNELVGAEVTETTTWRSPLPEEDF
jgi:hypothetical protein